MLFAVRHVDLSVGMLLQRRGECLGVSVYRTYVFPSVGARDGYAVTGRSVAGASQSTGPRHACTHQFSAHGGVRHAGCHTPDSIPPVLHTPA